MIIILYTKVCVHLIKVHVYSLFPECGKVYTFGSGFNGQLGLGTKVLCTSSPTCVKFKPKVIQVAAGENHTALITGKQGQVSRSLTGVHFFLAINLL